MAEIFWNSWLRATNNESVEYLFDAILLKKETPFPDHIIVPEFKEQEKIVIVTHIPEVVTLLDNELLMYVVSKVLNFIPEKCHTKILLSSDNQEIIKLWKEKFSICILRSEDYFIEIKKPTIEYSPFSSKTIKKTYLKNWYLPLELDQASQIIPIVPFTTSPIFKINGIISTFFWFLPTKLKNEILIQKTPEIRAHALMEIFSYLFPKITISGSLYQGEKNFSVFGNDPASVDSFSSALMSVKASSVPTTKYCIKHKIGVGDLLKIHVQGERFKKPVLRDKQIYKQKFDLFIDPKKCTLCGVCIDSCPLQAIFLQEKNLYYTKNHCNQCGFCVSICPEKAIKEI